MNRSRTLNHIVVTLCVQTRLLPVVIEVHSLPLIK